MCGCFLPRLSEVGVVVVDPPAVEDAPLLADNHGLRRDGCAGLASQFGCFVKSGRDVAVAEIDEMLPDRFTSPEEIFKDKTAGHSVRPVGVAQPLNFDGVEFRYRAVRGKEKQGGRLAAGVEGPES